jgi:hypothetical protein
VHFQSAQPRVARTGLHCCCERHRGHKMIDHHAQVELVRSPSRPPRKVVACRILARQMGSERQSGIPWLVCFHDWSLAIHTAQAGGFPPDTLFL